jgi:hypothetical protein
MNDDIGALFGISGSVALTEGNTALKLTDISLEPGIYPGISEDTYHALPYVGSTTLKNYAKNPAGSLLPFTPTDDMNLGSAIHSYSLQGESHFAENFAIMFSSPLNKNTNEYKALKADFVQHNDGKTILPESYYKTPTMEIIKGVDAALRSHDVAGMFLKQGTEELTLIWDDKDTGVRCKARIDFNPGRFLLVDLKKTANVLKFRNQMCDLYYDIQAGHYTNGARALGMKIDTFALIAVEAEPPYPVLTGYLSESWLSWACHEAHRQLSLYNESRTTGNWPNYQVPGHIFSLSQIVPDDLFVEFDMPPWR